MGELMIFVAVGTGLAIAALTGYRDWSRVARELGFEPPSFPAFKRRLRGTRRQLEVEIYPKSDDSQTRVVIEIKNVSPGFTLGRDSAMARLIKADIEIGEQNFDDLVRVQGDAVLARAVLGNEARRLARHVVTGGQGQVKDGKLQALVSKVTEVPAWLPTLLDLAETLRRPDRHEVPLLLSQRALSDRSAGVRLQAFRQLASSFRGSAELRRCAERLLDSSDLALRLEACRCLLGESEDLAESAARALIEIAKNRNIDSSLRRLALEFLTRSKLAARAVPAMAGLLRMDDNQARAEPEAVRRAALQGLLAARAVNELLEAQLSDDPAEAEIFARGVAQLGDVSIQPRLLAMLKHPADRVRVEAIRALGAVGDVRAVEPLRSVESSGFLQGLTISRETDQAVAQIQSRLGGSQAGEISLVGVSPLEGAISRADDGDSVGGELSLSDEPRPDRSPSDDSDTSSSNRNAMGNSE